jgi:hypothetical protein
MALQTYSKGSLFIDGVLVAESVEFSIDKKNNDQKVVTQNKGFSGISPGAGETEVKVTSAVPRVGVDMDYDELKDSRKVIQVALVARGKKQMFNGYIADVSENYSATAESKLSFTIMGEPVKITTA